MKNKFMNILSSPLMNLENVYRYSGVKLVENESLSIHIVESQILGYLMIDYINTHFDDSLDPGLYLEKALHHDLEESLTGDIARPLKYHNSQVLEELKKVGDSIAKELYNAYFCDSTQMYYIWENAKSGKEGFLLKVVDCLTVASKAIKEVKLFNNRYCLKVAYEVVTYLKELIAYVKDRGKCLYNDIRTIDYIISMLDDAISVVQGILDENHQLLSEYNVVEKSLLYSR